MTSFEIFQTDHADQPGLSELLGAVDLFPPDMLPDLLRPTLDGTTETIWLTARTGPRVSGFCYAVPEPPANGTWNMLALAVHPDTRRAGLGRALVAALEARLRDRGARLLIVDTSGADDLAPARALYAALEYAPEARIRDYWDLGDDRVTFTKTL